MADLPLPPDQLVAMYRQMWAIRHFDSQVIELLGKATGYCKGKGGSMHIADLDVGILGANGIVGGGVGIATGAGASIRLRRSGQVVVCFFGDGGLVQGVLHEAMNLASLWKLPVIYLCEINQYALATPISQEFGIPDAAAWAWGYGIPAHEVDGQDVLAVYEATRQAVERARRLDGPSFLACRTYRYAGHNVGDPEEYRSKDEVAEWRQQDPIAPFRPLPAAH